MKRIKIVGLCLTAVFALVAFSAMAASSAYAGEYGVCVKSKGGKYAEKNCLKLAGGAKEEKYEWVSAAGEKSTTSTKVAKLESAGGVIECKKSKGTAEITGAKTDVESTTFEDCTLSVTKGKCTSVQPGEPAGDITTFTLDTKLIDHGEKGLSGKEPAAGEVWDEFTGTEENGGVQAEYVCEPGVIFITKGSLSGVVTPVNAMESKSTTTFSATGGEQDLETLFSENGGETFESTGPNVENTVGTAKGVSAGSKEKGKTEVKAV